MHLLQELAEPASVPASELPAFAARFCFQERPLAVASVLEARQRAGQPADSALRELQPGPPRQHSRATAHGKENGEG